MSETNMYAKYILMKRANIKHRPKRKERGVAEGGADQRRVTKGK